MVDQYCHAYWGKLSFCPYMTATLLVYVYLFQLSPQIYACELEILLIYAQLILPGRLISELHSAINYRQWRLCGVGEASGDMAPAFSQAPRLAPTFHTLIFRG